MGIGFAFDEHGQSGGDVDEHSFGKTPRSWPAALSIGREGGWGVGWGGLFSCRKYVVVTFYKVSETLRWCTCVASAHVFVGTTQIAH